MPKRSIIVQGDDWSPEATAVLVEIRSLWEQADGAQWRLGELVHELETRHKRSLGQVAKALGRAKSTLSDFRSTWIAYKDPADRLGACWTDCHLARQYSGQVPLQARSRYGTAKSFLKEMLSRRETGKPCGARDLHRELVDEAKAEARTLSSTEYARLANQSPELVNSCRNLDCRDLLRSGELPLGSVQAFQFDPAYLGIDLKQSGGEGGYRPGREKTSALRAECADRTEAQAKPLILDIAGLALPYLKRNGCLYYWGNGHIEDDPEVVLAFRRAGWYCQHALYWNKGPSQPGNFDLPFSVSTERLLVWVRAGEELRDPSTGMSREQVLAFSEIQQRAQFPAVTRQVAAQMRHGHLPAGSGHMFEKPAALNDLLLRKAARPGELTVDLCGCSGSWCEAAIRYGCPFVYCEKDKTNFEWGAGRIAAALQARNGGQTNAA